MIAQLQKQIAQLSARLNKISAQQGYPLPLSNFNATAAPLVTDDSTKGYGKGSQWVFGSDAYTCTDATAGAAVWSAGGGGGEIGEQDYIDFDTTYTGAIQEARLQWDDDDGTLVFGLAGGNVHQSIGQTTLVRVVNKTGSTIGAGKVVYISGSQGSRPTIALADADDSVANTPIGVTVESLANNANGYMAISGIVRDLDTSAYSEGDALFLSTTAGEFTTTEPSPPVDAWCIAIVTNAHASEGSLEVNVVSHKSYTALDARYVEVGGDTMTGSLNVDGSSNAIQLKVKSDSTQTANIIEWQDSSGNVLGGVDDRGVLFSTMDIGDTTTIYGIDSGKSTMTGADNTLIGYEVGKSITTGTSNALVGVRTGNSMTTASNNMGLGKNALRNCVSGTHNMAIGVSALYYATSSQNVAVGTTSLFGTTSGQGNTSVGYNSGRSGTTHRDGVYIGNAAGYGGSGASGWYNTAIGKQALYDFTSGASNVAIGYRAGYNVTTGSHNILQGDQVAFTLTSGSYNVFIGRGAGYSNSTGSNNVFIGDNAGYNETGSDKLYIDISNTSDPLIYGEFDNDLVKINGRLRITDNSEAAVAGDIRYNSSTNKHQGYDGASWNDLY